MSRIIAKDSTVEYQTWQLPMVEDVSAAVADAKGNKASGLLTAEKIEQIQAQAYKEAYDAGYLKGHQEGVATGQFEVDRKSQLLGDLLQYLAEPLKQLDQSVEEELLSLAGAIARQLVRREFKIDPGEIIGAVREAMAALPVGSRDVRVVLHPEDTLLMQESVIKTDNHPNWTLNEDPSLKRGDCRIVTETSRIEATLEHRLAAVVSQMFGGERKQDASAENSPQSN